MSPQSRRAIRYSLARPVAHEREAIERRWFHRLLRADPGVLPLVTAQGAAQEPFHRWLAFRQGFAPELVRSFLEETALGRRKSSGLPILDPFSGSGTSVIECARGGAAAIGIEAAPSLAFLGAARFEQDCPPFPPISPDATWQEIGDLLTAPIHRAALMFALARLHTAEGKPLKNVPPLAVVLQDVVRMIREDLKEPLPLVGTIRQGDARALTDIPAAGIAAILTSPPYLAKYDYKRCVAPYERAYGQWYADSAPVQHGAQLRASATRSKTETRPNTSGRRRTRHELPPAVNEAIDTLESLNQNKLALLVAAYFEDLFQVLCECRRVLVTGAPCWIIIGGARLKGVYVPTDLILAEFAESQGGFGIQTARIARFLIESGRKLGKLNHVRPRETILELVAL